MLAMLLEITWTLSSWAIIPVAAVWSARMMIASQALGRDFGELLDRAAPQVAELLQHGGDLRIGARDLDHARHLDHRLHVRLLDRSLLYARPGRSILRRNASRRAEQRCAVLLQLLGVVEAHEAQPAARRIVARVAALARRNGAVRVDRDAVVGRLELDRAAVADHAVAVAGDELALGIDLEGAVARVAFAARGLHHEEGIAVDGDIERIAGRADRAGAVIAPGGAVLHEAHAPVGALEAGRLGNRHQIFLEHRAIGLVAGGVHVGDVISHDIELALERDLS